MKPKKDIFDLFRESEQKLAQRPSREAWKRLEDRLDVHKHKNKRFTIRMLAYAAAVLVLVVSVSLMTTLMQSPDSPDLAFEVEDMVVVNVSDDNYQQVREYQNIQANRLSSPIAEGKADKKLVPKMKMERRDGNLKKFYDKKKRENDEAISSKENLKPSTSSEVINETLSYATAGNEMEADLSKDIVAETAPAPVAFEAPAANKQEVPIVEEELAADDIAIHESEPAAQKIIDSSDEKVEAFMRGQSHKEYAVNKKTRQAGASAAVVSISDFQWLIGQWESSLNDKIILEQWQQKDDHSLLGTGSLLADGDVRLVDTMKIQNMGGTMYLLANFAGEEMPTTFRLISNQNGKAVFQNESGGLPKQVVLERR